MTRHADGFSGWPEESENDGILVTAASAEMPQELLRQLAPGEQMVIPVGFDGDQLLVCMMRTEAGYNEQVVGVGPVCAVVSGIVE